MYAIIEVVAKFHHYLFSHYFIIRTYQKSLKHLTDQVIQPPEQEEWLPKLLGFQYSIEYKQGTSNHATDVLSYVFAMAQSMPHSSLINDIKKATQLDLELQKLISQYRDQPTTLPFYSTKDDLLFLDFLYPLILIC